MCSESNALTVAVARSERARRRFASQIFRLAAAVLLVGVGWQLAALIPVGWWQQASDRVSAGLAVYAAFYFSYMGPLTLGLVLVGGIWIYRDHLIGVELRRFHHENPDLDVAMAACWIRRRRAGAKDAVLLLAVLWLLACWDGDGPGIAMRVAEFAGLCGFLVAVSFAFIELAYLGIEIPLADQAVSAMKAYESGYMYGRFHDGAVPEGFVSRSGGALINSGEVFNSYRDGVLAGQAMRNELRAQGFDVDARA